MAEEARVVVLMQPELRDTLKALGKAQGRVLMRQIEHILKEHVAAAKKAAK
jgi:hypothetical protein